MTWNSNGIHVDSTQVLFTKKTGRIRKSMSHPGCFFSGNPYSNGLWNHTHHNWIGHPHPLYLLKQLPGKPVRFMDLRCCSYFCCWKLPCGCTCWDLAVVVKIHHWVMWGHPQTMETQKTPEDFYGWNITGWWFQMFFMFIPIWGRLPFWLIFFKGVETTN